MTGKEWIEPARVLVPFGVAALGIAATVWVSVVQNRKATRQEDLRWGRERARLEGVRRNADAAKPFDALYEDVGLIGELATRFGNDPAPGERAVQAAIVQGGRG